MKMRLARRRSPARSQRRGDAQRAVADAAADERGDVGARLPAEHHHAVERPDVDVLEPVPRLRRLRRREPRERRLADVVVVAVDVRVRVVRDVVLDAPRVAAEAEQRVGGPAHQVVEAPRAEVGAVVRVVLDAEPDQDRPERRGRPEQRRRAQTPGRTKIERRPTTRAQIANATNVFA